MLPFGLKHVALSAPKISNFLRRLNRHDLKSHIKRHLTTQYQMNLSAILQVFWARKVNKNICHNFSSLNPIDCQDALGMESGAITDGQISALSQWDGNHAAVQGRLHFQASGGKQGAWSSRANDVNQWLQIDLGDSYTTVTRVASQGRQNSDQWVKKYTLQYSNDGVNYQNYREQGQAVIKVKYSMSAIKN